MRIYHYHAETLELIAESIADADPLEEGRHLIPAQATDIAPPAVLVGKTRHFEAGAWVYRDIPVPPAPPVPTAAEIKAATNAPILAQIATIEARQGRALREVALGQAGAVARMQTLDTQIVALRAQLVP